ncbi:MAG: 16S rRNA (cytidine(1402)-2'-O)-methyltransferase, partial [Acidobacteriota bacterium]|nr:16S rRNA (cytidine(1402)-2'-O)-methyltransferase [Acidobacteriota bacterium]
MTPARESGSRRRPPESGPPERSVPEQRPVSAPAPHGALVVCPTPIGNLEDITLRALRVLAEADLIACEDTRRTRILLAHHGIRADALLAVHEHNERRRSAELVERVRSGQTVALVSDAGMPVISDPGFVVVRACLQAGLRVDVLPGPSAVEVALVASGLPPARYTFAGFLPRKRGERTRLLAQAGETIVAFESPARLSATLELLAELDPDRPAAICREL